MRSPCSETVAARFSARLVMAAPSLRFGANRPGADGNRLSAHALLVAARLLGVLRGGLQPVGLVRGSQRILALVDRVGLGVELLEASALLAGRDLGLGRLGGLARLGLALVGNLRRAALAGAALLLGRRSLLLGAPAGLRALLLGLPATGGAALLGLLLALVGLALARRRLVALVGGAALARGGLLELVVLRGLAGDLADGGVGAIGGGPHAVLFGGAAGSGGELERLLERPGGGLYGGGGGRAGDGQPGPPVL